jgi:hypothetical protein
MARTRATRTGSGLSFLLILCLAFLLPSLTAAHAMADPSGVRVEDTPQDLQLEVGSTLVPYPRFDEQAAHIDIVEAWLGPVGNESLPGGFRTRGPPPQYVLEPRSFGFYLLQGETEFAVSYPRSDCEGLGLYKPDANGWGSTVLCLPGGVFGDTVQFEIPIPSSNDSFALDRGLQLDGFQVRVWSTTSDETGVRARYVDTAPDDGWSQPVFVPAPVAEPTRTQTTSPAPPQTPGIQIVLVVAILLAGASLRRWASRE